MEKLTVKTLKDALANLEEDKEVEIKCYSNVKEGTVEVELIKEIKENGSEYYKLLI